MLLRILFVLTGFLHAALAADNYPRNEAVDIKCYIFRLELNDTTNRIAGQATVKFVVKKPYAILSLT